jgi:TRAP-type C4-dicarboxylate transport system substrate-binding protein
MSKFITGQKVFAAVLSGAIATLASSAFAQEVLKWGHVYESATPYHEAALKAATAFEAATEGRYSIEVFPASQLGKEVALNEGLALGTVDIIYTGVAFMGQSYPPIAISDFPFTMRDFDHWVAYSGSDLFREMATAYTGITGNHVSGLTYYGARHVTANKPILTPADMVDLKIRTPNAPAYQLFPEVTGANPTPMAFSEGKSFANDPVQKVLRGSVEYQPDRPHHQLAGNFGFTCHSRKAGCRGSGDAG